MYCVTRIGDLCRLRIKESVTTLMWPWAEPSPPIDWELLWPSEYVYWEIDVRFIHQEAGEWMDVKQTNYRWEETSASDPTHPCMDIKLQGQWPTWPGLQGKPQELRFLSWPGRSLWGCPGGLQEAKSWPTASLVALMPQGSLRHRLKRDLAVPGQALTSPLTGLTLSTHRPSPRKRNRPWFSTLQLEKGCDHTVYLFRRPGGRWLQGYA